jgi:hypothetical protein
MYTGGTSGADLKPYRPLTSRLTPHRPVTIDAGLPMPAHGLPRLRKYPWHAMLIGDSFLIAFPPHCERPERRRIQLAAAAMVAQANAREARRRGSRRWAQRTVDDDHGFGVRVWRLT